MFELRTSVRRLAPLRWSYASCKHLADVHFNTQDMKASMVVLAVMITCLTACDSATDVPSDSPDIMGEVIAKPASVSGYAFEVDVNPPFTEGPIYAVKVDPSTRIVQQKLDGKLIKADLNDVKVGFGVNVWFSSPPVDGNPARATARVILIRAIL